MLTSDLLLKEFNAVMQRPKFKVDPVELDRNVRSLMKIVKMVDVVSKFDIAVVVRDFKDNVVLETAYDGKADFIVTGDADLLSLHSFRGINIVSVNQMLMYLEENSV